MFTPRIASIFTVLIMATVIVGCAGMGGGPSNEELIVQLVTDWKAAVMAKDVNGIVLTYAEDFRSPQGMGKEESRASLTGMFEEGVLDNLTINMDTAVVTVSDKTATFAPVQILGNMGEVTMDFELVAQEDGSWLISALNTTY
jgi:ketosteroid isomerase-like protein